MACCKGVWVVEASPRSSHAALIHFYCRRSGPPQHHQRSCIFEGRSECVSKPHICVRQRLGLCFQIQLFEQVSARVYNGLGTADVHHASPAATAPAHTLLHPLTELVEATAASRRFNKLWSRQWRTFAAPPDEDSANSNARSYIADRDSQPQCLRELTLPRPGTQPNSNAGVTRLLMTTHAASCLSKPRGRVTQLRSASRPSSCPHAARGENTRKTLHRAGSHRLPPAYVQVHE